jgi:hypothetical protein
MIRLLLCLSLLGCVNTLGISEATQERIIAECVKDGGTLDMCTCVTKTLHEDSVSLGLKEGDRIDMDQYNSLLQGAFESCSKPIIL